MESILPSLAVGRVKEGKALPGLISKPAAEPAEKRSRRALAVRQIGRGREACDCWEDGWKRVWKSIASWEAKPKLP